MNAKSQFRFSRIAARTVIFTVAFAAPELTALAAGEPGAAAADKSADTVIVSTADRRDVPIQDIPNAVSVWTEQTLTGDLHVVSSRDFLNFVPSGRYIQDSPDEAAITIRGIKAETLCAGCDGGVVVRQDSMVLSRSWMRNANDYFDVSRIQVVPGPQVVDFGRNAMGGAIQILTNRPTFEQDLSVTGEVGNYSHRQIDAVANLPLSDTLATRLTAHYRARDGYFTNEANGNHVDNNDTKAGRAQVLFEPGDSVEILVRGSYAKDHYDVANPADALFSNVPLYFGPNIIPNFPAVPYTPSDSDPRTVGVLPGQFFDRTLWDAGSDMTFKRDDLTLTSSTNFNHGGINNIRDLFGTSASSFRQQSSEDSNVVQQDLHLDNAAAKSRLSWSLGGNYLHEDSKRGEFRRLLITTPFQTYNTFREHNLTNSFSAYGTGQFELTGTTTLSAGVRYTHDHKNYQIPIVVCGGRPDPDADPALAGPAPGVTGLFCPVVVHGYPAVTSFSGGNEASWNNTSYRVAVMQKLGPAWNVYASYATGFKAGGLPQEPNTTASLAYTPFGPEHIGTVEVGAKGHLFNDALYASVAIYHSDYTDIEADVNDPATGAGYIVNSDGGATIQGVEWQLDWRITDRLNLTVNGDYMDAYYNGAGLHDANGNVYASSYEESDTGHFTGLPVWKGYVGASYTAPLAGGSTLRFFVDGRFSGPIQDFVDAEGTSVNGLQANWPMNPVLGTNITWTSAGGNIAVQLWGKNLTNADDWMERRESFLFDDTAYRVPGTYNGLARAGDPRTFGISAAYHWR